MVQATDARERCEERAVLVIGEGVQESDPPRARQERDLDRPPVADVPVHFRAHVGRGADRAEGQPAAHHPERNAQIVPSECGRRDLLAEVPRRVERVGAVEHTEEIGFAPHHLLAPDADPQRPRARRDVDVGLAHVVLERERLACVDGEIAQVALCGTAGLASAKVALAEDRRVRVDAVVNAAIGEDEARVGEEPDVDPARLRVAQRVPAQAEAKRVALLNEVPLVDVGVTDEVL